MSNNQSEVLWTIKDVQNYFKCGRNKALSIMQSKTFPSFQIGKTHYVAESEVYEWVRKNKNNYIKLQ